MMEKEKKPLVIKQEIEAPPKSAIFTLAQE